MCPTPTLLLFFFFNDTATTEIYTLSLHDALPISSAGDDAERGVACAVAMQLAMDQVNARSRARGLPSIEGNPRRSEEHTSELQSPCNLVCRLLLEKKKKKTSNK